MKYSIILADPPWDYKGQTQHAGVGKSNTGGALLHYPTMTVDEMIQQIHPITIAEDDCLLFMWSTWPHLDQAIKLGNGWGFKYVHTPFIWNKGKTNPGFYTLTQTEPVLCFKRGKIPQPRGSRKEKQLIEKLRTRHSEKPKDVHERIDRMFPNHKKIEMFARTQYPGWDVWGNQIISNVIL
jgi:N6-adenosine-specific RNA methylase IME4